MRLMFRNCSYFASRTFDAPNRGTRRPVPSRTVAVIGGDTQMKFVTLTGVMAAAVTVVVLLVVSPI